MSTTPTSSSGPHRGRRLRNFLLPDGRQVHIASTPEDTETLRKRLEAIHQDQPFDLVVNGSPEHLDALKRAHSHHEQKQQTLRDRHGKAYDEFEQVRTELDTLRLELNALTEQTVSLNANFSKYGYSAHLRTYDDDESPSLSRKSSIVSGDPEKKDWEEERGNGRAIKIYSKPTVRQYFHKGLLWRASECTEVASFELFLDLLYVGILAINGDHASEDPTGYELLRFAITFIMSWKIWSDVALIISWFKTDDIIQRVSVLFIMACLLGLTTNNLDAFESTYSQLVAFYLAARLFMGSYCLAISFLAPMVRGMMVLQAVAILIPSALWIGSIYVEMPNRLALIWIAIFLDLTLLMTGIMFVQRASLISKSLGAFFDRAFEFYPATNIEHRTERTNAFVTLVFGYSVVAVIYQSSASFGLNAFFGKAVLGLFQAFCFNWIYFELDGAELFQHAIRRSMFAASVWTSIHLPFIMSFVLGGAALSKLVLATDCQDANVEDLTENYQAKSEVEVAIGLRWFYCAGFGIALACMSVISMTHVHKESNDGRIRLAKRYRMANRLAICIIMICLPLAHSLNSLHLVSVVTGLLVWVLLLELWGASCPDDSFFGEASCKYTARCKVSKKELETAAKSGNPIDVQKLGRKGNVEYEVN